MNRIPPSRRLATLTGLTLAATLALTACNPPSESNSDGPLPENQEDLVAAAQEEGRVSLGAGGHTNAQAQLLADMFQEEYGITVEFVRENSGQIGQKVEAQRDAGNVTFDVISLNDSSTLNAWAEEEVLAEPEVENADDVLDPLEAESDRFIAFTWAAAGFVYNESNTEESEVPGTWQELAETDSTKVVADPGTSGAALTFVGAIEQTAPDLLPALGEGNVLTSESALALGQMVATGEAEFGLPGVEHDVSTAQSAGEPLAMGYPEGELGIMPSYIAALTDAAHPAAARLLVQYSLSEEFQEAQRELGSRSTLESVGVPEGMEELEQERMLVLDQDDLTARKDELIAGFEEAIR